MSAASSSGWGSSNSETLLMSWFAKRPLAQSRAAVLCSLLPWPEDEDEQRRVQAVLREALGTCQDPDWYACRNKDCDKLDCSRKSHMEHAPRSHAHDIVDCAKLDPSGGYDAARTDVLRLLKDAYPDRPAEMLDPFSGRGLIPLEAARYGQQAHAIDYSPVATLASRLLIDWPFRDWSAEPELPFDPPDDQLATFDPSDPQRLIRDIAIVQAEVQRRIEVELDKFYPDNDCGEKPWGYLWAQVIPCDGCSRRFPLFGANTLRLANARKGDSGCSFEIVTDNQGWTVAVREGQTDQQPTVRGRGKTKGKLAWCPFPDCGHAHELNEHKRLVRENFRDLEMLAVADIGEAWKEFRAPTEEERRAAGDAGIYLASLEINGLPARPDETIVPRQVRISGETYGAKSFGDLSVERQNLLHATMAKAFSEIADEVVGAGSSADFANALVGYCSATLSRKLKRATRGARLQTAGGAQVGDIFVNESSTAFNYDSFEAGIGKGPGTWLSVASAPSALAVLAKTSGRPGVVNRGSALHVPYGDGALDAVVTDPPYGAMIQYTDLSDLVYVWLKRALARHHADFAFTANPRGTQEKTEEIITHTNYATAEGEHRTPEHYRINIAKAFAECRRVVHNDGVVSIVFGHGDPDVWRELLDAVAASNLVLTGAWPANTEKGGQAGSANIQTTLTLACRPAPPNRSDGKVAEVDAEMRRVIADRVRNVWNPSGLSYVDQKMAASGPALEVVGQYAQVLDKRGQPVDLTRYLPLARQAVTEAHNLSFDSLPLDTFDQKTRFALEWVRSYGRKVQAASEARWNRLSSDLEESDTAGVLAPVDKGVRLAFAAEAKVESGEGLSLFEAAMAAAVAWKNGTLADTAAVIRDCKVEGNDPHFWACVRALSQNLPETDKDGAVWTSMVRNREALAGGVANAEAAAAAVVDRED
ncbi:MAG: hypothetical protein WD942_10435, partial [Dehalococcoidia bacterium]